MRNSTEQSDQSESVRPAAKVYVDGELLPQDQAKVSSLDRGFTLGDGIFETMLLKRGQIFRLAEHLARLRRSAATIHLVVPHSDQELGEALQSVAKANGLSEAVLRLTISRGVPLGRGLLPTGEVNPTIVVQPSPFTPPSAQKYEEGYKAVTATVCRNEHSPTAFIKSCNYLDNVLARMEAASAGADEAIMMNTSGLVACGSSSNVFLIGEERLVTPSIQTGVLAGITRAAVISLARQMGIFVSEQKVVTSDFSSCEEAFFTNTVIGVMPLVKLDGNGIGVGRPGPLTAKLREAYERLVEAETGA